MVNKAALSVLGVIVLVSMGVGVLIGMQIGGGGAGTTSESTPTAGPSTEQGAAGNGDSGPARRTTIPGDEAATAQPPAERETIPARQFEPAEIRAEMKTLINQRRANRDLSELSTGGQIADRLDRMARGHSVEMADEDRVSHSIDGNTSVSRYKDAGLFGTCQFESDPGTFVVDARYNRLEVIGYTVAGRAHDGEFHETEENVAEAIVSDWFSGTSRDRLLYENANQLGIGIEVTQDGDVYATGNLC
ncbi:hypothetical protein BV210_00915 [Halorientalis sp. IM1011]|uniref:CAP domain-containing protein n=1 Tax=Halorientalis sp. IM1011 TaxID=1932360 RepID=UPI00097CC54B|nr:CAP domain-containing protein [Halorientalis sp. IM1011]AQL41361.1 hypothetical protein BV210_00915 [Halorientalis sp. IM1011]